MHYAEDGRMFYFNSSINQSVWHLPEGAEVFHPNQLAAAQPQLYAAYAAPIAQNIVHKPLLERENE
jgi:hypothetical protein